MDLLRNPFYKYGLIHWLLAYWNINLEMLILVNFIDDKVNIGSGKCLGSGNKPLPEPILIQIYVAIWCH